MRNRIEIVNPCITKICVAIRLAEDGTRMGGIQFQLSPAITNKSENKLNKLITNVTR